MATRRRRGAPVRIMLVSPMALANKYRPYQAFRHSLEDSCEMELRMGPIQVAKMEPRKGNLLGQEGLAGHVVHWAASQG